MTPQSGTFTARATVIPTFDTQSDGGIGLAQGQPSSWSAGASAIVLFAPDGTIKVYKGDLANYAADAVVHYQLLGRYRVRMAVDVGHFTYSVFVIPDGSSTEIQLASGYPFRFNNTPLDN